MMSTITEEEPENMKNKWLQADFNLIGKSFEGKFEGDSPNSDRKPKCSFGVEKVKKLFKRNEIALTLIDGFSADFGIDINNNICLLLSSLSNGKIIECIIDDSKDKPSNYALSVPGRYVEMVSRNWLACSPSLLPDTFFSLYDTETNRLDQLTGYQINGSTNIPLFEAVKKSIEDDKLTELVFHFGIDYNKPLSRLDHYKFTVCVELIIEGTETDANDVISNVHTKLNEHFEKKEEEIQKLKEEKLNELEEEIDKLKENIPDNPTEEIKKLIEEWKGNIKKLKKERKKEIEKWIEEREEEREEEIKKLKELIAYQLPVISKELDESTNSNSVSTSIYFQYILPCPPCTLDALNKK